MNKRYFIVSNKTRKVVLLSLLLSSMMNSITQASDWSKEIVGAIAVTTVATLYATRSYWWPTREDKNQTIIEQTEEESFEDFRNRTAAKRKQQNEEVEAAERQDRFRQQGELQKQIEFETSEHADLLKRSTERRKQQAGEVAHHQTWNKIDQAQEHESLA